MAFPDITTLSPQDGAVHIIGDVKFVYSTATGKWEKIDEIATARFVAPVNPYNGQLWFDTDTSGRLYIWNEAATSWIQLTGHQLDGGGNATTGYVDNAIANLIDSSPSTLNTLNEIAQAIGDDPNFGTSITSSITNKLNISDFTTTANSWATTTLSVSTLGDVSTNPPTNGQVLTYDNASGYWYAATPVSAAASGAVMSTSGSTASMSFVVDEDNMASNSDTKVPTQQSVKSYVDSIFTGFSLASVTGTLDDVSDGFSFVKSQTNFTSTLNTKLQGISPFANKATRFISGDVATSTGTSYQFDHNLGDIPDVIKYYWVLNPSATDGDYSNGDIIDFAPGIVYSDGQLADAVMAPTITSTYIKVRIGNSGPGRVHFKSSGGVGSNFLLDVTKWKLRIVATKIF